MAHPITEEEAAKWMHVIDRLDGRFKTRYWNGLVRCWTAGVEVVPFFGVRDPWTQARMWRRSRTRARVEAQLTKMRDVWDAPWTADVLEEVGPQPTEPWATNAVPGMSWHQQAKACDAFVRNPDGSADWSGDSYGYRILAREMYRAGLAPGFFWRQQDSAHVQLGNERILPGIFANSYPVMDRLTKKIWEPEVGLQWLAAVRNYGIDLERSS